MDTDDGVYCCEVYYPRDKRVKCTIAHMSFLYTETCRYRYPGQHNYFVRMTVQSRLEYSLAIEFLLYRSLSIYSILSLFTNSYSFI